MAFLVIARFETILVLEQELWLGVGTGMMAGTAVADDVTKEIAGDPRSTTIQTPKSPRGERDSHERDSRRSYAVWRSRSPWSARKERESRKGDSRRPHQRPRFRSIEPNATAAHSNAGTRGLHSEIRGAGINQNAVWRYHGASIRHHRIPDFLSRQSNQTAQFLLNPSLNKCKMLESPASSPQLN